jgi:hypothetical protein
VTTDSKRCPASFAIFVGGFILVTTTQALHPETPLEGRVGGRRSEGIVAPDGVRFHACVGSDRSVDAGWSAL